ncbi:MAG: hypothetical protein RIS64_741 [Bacteroidota bacterium]
MNKNRYILLFLIVNNPLFGQIPKGISFEPSVHIGKVLKHTSKLTYDVPPMSMGAELHYNYQRYGKAAWHERQNYPLIGASFLYYNFGDNAILGEGFALYPTLNLKIFNLKQVRTDFVIGSGLGWASRPYNTITNPKNNALGSNWNNLTQLKFISTFPLGTHWKAFGGMSFSHFSNGSRQLPNYGINVVAANVGVQYTPNPLTSADFIKHNSLNDKVKRRFGVQIKTDIAWVASQLPDGPMYPIYIETFAGAYQRNPSTRWYLGMDYEQNQAVYEFNLHALNVNTRDEARLQAMRLAPFLAYEQWFGSFSIYLQTGTYIGNFYTKPGAWYNKLGLRYYMPAWKGIRAFGGGYLKAHRFTAEYGSIGIGLEWVK